MIASSAQAARATILALLIIAAATLSAKALDLPVAAVGKVNYAGLSSRTTCTGVLIAPDKVLTAAHCIIANDQSVRNPESLHFVAGYDRGSYRAHSLAREVRLAPDYLGSVQSNNRFGKDYALIFLKDKLDIPFVPLATPATEAPLFVIHAGYRNERPEVLTISPPCILLPQPQAPWPSTCPTAGGSSGGPLFAVDDGAIVLAAIIVARIGKGENSLAIPVNVWREFVEGAQ